MSKRSKYQSKEFVESDEEEGSGSGSDTKQEKKAKKAKPAAKSEKKEENEDFIDLGRNRRVTVRKFHGKVLIDIREYYDAGGEMKPGKKGISLSTEQWDKIKALAGDIDKAIKEC
eukprot:comp7892_c0_seq1/m.3470 comp7892_c0_seq1/g.3470  ORF comp7892_c0_seq1/g.3470 comp7892_c0_seq1/m.3470 type:complete len:115 (-) comp7892_c0_seq1:248-592(-)